ncbi:phosphatidylinositol-glycan biosynthesis class X protein isoform X2 [Myripristis murdjan]|uniref:phosphatidylinositol-glycan biosynthesis class X protein isoform X2 n=1 Tax=Myripristis murdjan TaxID=586833 RepID=UPI00117629DA|nr:phosphatidylinositol-glycan biosynthesis class X protein isoform X2 [Myripristis murdjan]
MYFLLFFTLACLSTCYCRTENDEKAESMCGLLRQSLTSTSVSVEIDKKGFHRDVVTTVEFSPDGPSDLQALVVHKWPRGIYVDPYQLASLSEHTDWQVLLDSAIDLEVPAHKTVGLVAFVFPALHGRIPRLLKVTVPVHGRYHEPSFDGKKFTSIDLDPPELLLRTGKCQLSYLDPHTIVDAPCTADNSSICQWARIQHKQGQASFQLPVGDGLLVIPVCSATLLVTLVCCVALAKTVWKHQLFTH